MDSCFELCAYCKVTRERASNLYHVLHVCKITYQNEIESIKFATVESRFASSGSLVTVSLKARANHIWRTYRPSRSKVECYRFPRL